MVDKKEQLKQYMKEYRQTHKIEIEACRKRYYPKYYQEHKEELLANSRAYYQKHKTEKSILRHRNSQKVKTEVLIYYGNGKLACVRCGYVNIEALSIDHINGDGCKHRNIIGNTIYGWLKRNNFPKGYQTLCMNCQFIKRDESRERTGGFVYAIPR